MLTVERAKQVRFESCGPYAMRFRGADRIKFGAVLSGRLELLVDGADKPLRLERGDCYLLTDGRGYRSGMADVPEMDGDSFFAAGRDADGTVRFGDGPPDKIVIGGAFVFDPFGTQWLRSALPPLIYIDAASPSAAPLRATLDLFRTEVAAGGAPGENVMVDRLADILLIQALRAHLAQGGPRDASWLAGLADPRLGKALRAFHADVAADWTVAGLADIAGMSRSSFAERFLNRVGMTPLDYLTRWRMQRMRRALLDSDLPFGTIAARNGYRSRSSGSQAFARMFGCTPQELRTSHSLPEISGDA